MNEYVAPRSLKDQVVIITGGNGAIGQGMVDVFTRANAHVVVADPSNAKTDVESLGEGVIVHHQTDVTNFSAIEQMVEKTIEQFGRIDVLINNAGGQVRPTRFLDMSADMFEWEINLNIYGTLFCSQLVGRHMAERKRGSIINISSNAALKGSAGQYAACYAGCKGFVLSLAKTLAYDFAQYGVRVNTIAPGWIVPDDSSKISEDSFWLRFANDMFGEPEKFDQEFSRTGKIHSVPDQPLKRLGRPQDIAEAAYFFASDASAHLTGQLLSIGGGDYMPS